MTIVSLRNKNKHTDFIGFDLSNLRVVKLPNGNNNECGDFIVLEDETKVGFVNASMADENFEQFLFFIGDAIFDFNDASFVTTVNYIDEKTGNFTLSNNNEVLINLNYSREKNADFGGWLVGNWETEEEKDIFMNIHEIMCH